MPLLSGQWTCKAHQASAVRAHLGHEHFFVRRHVGDEMPPHNCARLLPGVVWSSAVDPSFPRKISVPSKSAFALRPSSVLRPPIAGSVLLSIGHIQIEFFIRRPRLPACSFPELAAAISLTRPRNCVLPTACFIVGACGACALIVRQPATT